MLTVWSPRVSLSGTGNVNRAKETPASLFRKLVSPPVQLNSFPEAIHPSIQQRLPYLQDRILFPPPPFFSHLLTHNLVAAVKSETGQRLPGWELLLRKTNWHEGGFCPRPIHGRGAGEGVRHLGGGGRWIALRLPDCRWQDDFQLKFVVAFGVYRAAARSKEVSCRGWRGRWGIFWVGLLYTCPSWWLSPETTNCSNDPPGQLPVLLLRLLQFPGSVACMDEWAGVEWMGGP